jgi:hypothetical protein
MSWRKFVFVDDCRWDVLAMDAHVLIDGHVRTKKEILEITSAVACAVLGVRDSTVEMEFGVEHANGGRANVLIGVKFIATDRHTDAVRFSFTRSHGADEVGIGYLATGGDLIRTNKENGLIANNVIGSGTIFGDTLSTASPLVGERGGPDV